MTFWQKTKLILSGFWSFLEPFVKQFLTDAGKIVAQEALAVVPLIAASMSGSDGASKREAAIAQIKINLLNRGIEVTTTMVLNAIQAAYTKLKSDGVIE